MTSTCLVCCEESDYFVLPPCNHTEICWKCCLKLVEGSIFCCPFCNDKPQIKSQLLFVTKKQMKTSNYAAIMNSNPFRSNKNTFYFYSNAVVAQYIESETSFHCTLCGEVHLEINQLKKHIHNMHKRQFCDICLDNRRCIIPEQRLYSEIELQIHLKSGDISVTGEVLLYHPSCQFCNKRFYDLDAFKMHLKMSSHLKCDICDLNTQKLKYIYYKNYDDLEQHHHKTHFVCDIGDCIGKKLLNVFVSEERLQDHKRNVHRKHKGDKSEKVENIILGFNRNAEEEAIIYDGIGKNFQKQFTIFQREEKVDKQNHSDDLVDIREFYIMLAKANNNTRIDDIIDKIRQLHQVYSPKSQVYFSQIQIFLPLQMPSLSRIELQRLLRRSFPSKDADFLIELYFTKKNQYITFNQFFNAIERKMKSYSNISFYMTFPQLIRFMKDENKSKIPMDTYYGQKLRALTVSKPFIFHTIQRYSGLFQFLKAKVEQQVKQRCAKGLIEMDVYLKYMREMKSNFYLQNQDEIYYVSKDKITNLYHMIERCKTRDLLKMNWLLKVGLKQDTYQYIMTNCTLFSILVLYKTKEECEQNIFQNFKIKELALIYIYTVICLQALLDGKTFGQSKKNSRPHFFSDFLGNIDRPSQISLKLLDEIKQSQNHSFVVQKKVREIYKKSMIIDQSECPSLLQAEPEFHHRRKPPEDQASLINIGRSRLQVRREDRVLPKKVEISKQQQFPVLVKNEKTQFKQKKKEEDFPVFNFQQKFVNKKIIQKAQTKNQMINYISFGSKTVSGNRMNEEKLRQKFDQVEKEKRKQQEKEKQRQKQRRLIKQKQISKQRQKRKQQKIQQKQETISQQQDDGFVYVSSKKRNNFIEEPKRKNELKRQTKKQTKIQSLTPTNKDEEDEALSWAIKQSLKENQKKNNKEKEKEPEVILISKKAEPINDNQVSKKKKKYKKGQNMQQQKPVLKNNDSLLFEQIQNEAIIIKAPKEKKKHGFRIDVYDSGDEQIVIVESGTKKLYESYNSKNKTTFVQSNPPEFKQQQFEVIGQAKKQQTKQSIINRLIKQKSCGQEKKEGPIIKNGRNGKRTKIERVDWF